MLRRMLCGMMILIAAGGPVRAAEPSELDWSAWEQLPVYHDGRIMPLVTLASSSVETICNRENPTLRLKGAVPESTFDSPELAAARELFPNDEPRKFRAPELLLSWLVEPEKWEEVPFLIAEHGELRETILDLPVTNEAGEHLKYVSPAQVKDAAGFWDKIGDMARRTREADARGEKPEFTSIETKVNELYDAFQLYHQFRQLGMGGALSPGARMAVRSRLEAVAGSWSKLEGDLQLLRQAGDRGGLEEPVEQAEQAIQQLVELYQDPAAGLSEMEAAAETLSASTREIAANAQTIHRRSLDAPPGDWSEEQTEKLRSMLKEMATDTAALSKSADELQAALYDNDQWLRVVPALDAAALDADRNPEDAAQPWLDLQTLLYGSARPLRGYPQPEVKAVRDAFGRVKDVYPQRATRPNDFNASLESFAGSLRELGTAIEPIREELPIKNRDEQMIAYTAYPPPGFTDTEVRYSKLDPFLYAWIINFLALLCFAVYFIGIRWRSIFWGGLSILGFGLAWSAYGFYMRTVITGWAPVTNMYETVIYVPFFVALLGGWFALLPLTWPGLKLAWRMTAVPGTWEATPLTDEQTALMKPSTWQSWSFALLFPRVALAILALLVLAVWPYAAGGRTIINLWPNVAVGQSLPDGNDLLTWAVGWCVLATTMWFVPRAIITVLLGFAALPWIVRRQGSASLFPQVYARWPFGLSATFVASFGAFVAWYSPVLDENFSPLQPILRDNFWLFIHVLTIVSSYGAGALAWGNGNLALGYYLFGKYRAPVVPSARTDGHRPARADDSDRAPISSRAKRPPVECAALSSYVYKSVQVAVVLLAAGTILGALWADVAWGRFWGWDPKEVWALISLLVYLAMLHARYAGLVGDFGLVVGSVLGASAIIMSWYGVNFVLGVGLHSYGFGAGGQLEVGGMVVLNWIFLGAAAIRYRIETSGGDLPSPPPSDDAVPAELVSQVGE